MCLYTRLIQNKKYIAKKKNGGIIPAVPDKRVLAVPIGCGKCMECLKQKGREWQVRLMEEIKSSKNGIFVTLTFSNESIQNLYKDMGKLEGYELDNEIAKKQLEDSLKGGEKQTKKRKALAYHRTRA